MRAILTWHSIDDSGSPVSVHPDAFARQVAWLASGGVRVVPLERLAAGDDDAPAVALTFDDAFANFADQAWPRLRDAGLPVTLFVVSGHAGRTNAWGGTDAPGIPTLPLLDWDALGALASAGVELGAHTHTHPDLTGVDDARLADELGRCADEMTAHTGTAPAAFAYPFGAVDARVAGAAASRYRRAVTTDLRALGDREDTLRLPRIDAWYLQAPGRLERWGTRAFAAWLGVRRAGRRLRSALAGAGARA